MIRRLLLSALVVCTVGAWPGGAYACSVTGWLGASASEPEAVAAAQHIVLARSVATIEGRYSYRIEEVLRGDDAVDGSEIDDESAEPCSFYRGAEAEPPGGLYLFLQGSGDTEKGWLPIPGLPGRRKVAGPDDPLVARVREYVRIAELGDEAAQEEPLRQLQREAAKNPERYPAGLAADLERHFRVVSPHSSFARLRALYEQAVYPEQRVEALWDMVLAPHAETLGFVRERLASGEDLGPELAPIGRFFLEWKDRNDLALFVAGALASQGGDEIAVRVAKNLAESGDDSALWSVLRAHPKTLAELVYWFKEHPPTTRQSAEITRLYRRLSEPEKDEVAWRVWASVEGKPLLPLLLAGDDPQGRTARLASRPDALVRAIRAARTPARRRALLIRRFGTAGESEIPLVLQVLREKPETGTFLLPWLAVRLQESKDVPPALTAWIQGARNEADAAGALLAVATLWREDLLRETARGLASRLPVRAVRASPTLALLVRATRSSPELLRSWLLFEVVRAAGEDDRGLLLDLLRDQVEDAEVLAPWFVRHPDPEATPLLAARLDRQGKLSFAPDGEEADLATALAAGGDPGVVARVVGLLDRRSMTAATNFVPVVAHSPLPEAEVAARRLMATQPGAEYYWVEAYADPNNHNPRRWEMLEELAQRPDLANVLRGRLERLARDGEPEARRLLATLPSPSPVP